MALRIPVVENPVFGQFKPTIQLCLEMDSQSGINSFSNYLQKTVYALQLRKVDNFIERHKDINKIPIVTIPKHVNDSFQSMKQLSNYVQNNFPLNFSEGYGLIAKSSQNSKRQYIVLNVDHDFGDGQYFRFLVDRFLHHTDHSIEHLPHFPLQPRDSLKDFWNKSPQNIKDELHDENLTRFFSNDMANIRDDEFDHFITIKFPSSKICKDSKKLTSISNFTEKLYMGNYFAICSHEKKILDSFGVINVVDFKKHLKREQTFADTSYIGFVSPYTEGITSNKLVSQVGKEMKYSLISKMDKLEHFGYVISNEYNKTLPRYEGITTEFTNVGGVHIKKPVIDLWMSINIKCTDRQMVSNMGFSVIRDDINTYSEKEKENRTVNDIVLRYRYSPRVLSKNESTKLAKSIYHFLTDIPYESATVGSAYEKVQFFYNSL